MGRLAMLTAGMHRTGWFGVSGTLLRGQRRVGFDKHLDLVGEPLLPLRQIVEAFPPRGNRSESPLVVAGQEAKPAARKLMIEGAEDESSERRVHFLACRLFDQAANPWKVGCNGADILQNQKRGEEENDRFVSSRRGEAAD